MAEVKVGDIVARISHGQDIFFKVDDIKVSGDEKTIILRGITYRIMADAPECDLVIQTERAVHDYCKKSYISVWILFMQRNNYANYSA